MKERISGQYGVITDEGALEPSRQAAELLTPEAEAHWVIQNRETNFLESNLCSTQQELMQSFVNKHKNLVRQYLSEQSSNASKAIKEAAEISYGVFQNMLSGIDNSRIVRYISVGELYINDQGDIKLHGDYPSAISICDHHHFFKSCTTPYEKLPNST